MTDTPTNAPVSEAAAAVAQASAARANEIVAMLLTRLTASADPTETFIYKSELCGLKETLAAIMRPIPRPRSKGMKREPPSVNEVERGPFKAVASSGRRMIGIGHTAQEARNNPILWADEGVDDPDALIDFAAAAMSTHC